MMIESYQLSAFSKKVFAGIARSASGGSKIIIFCYQP